MLEEVVKQLEDCLNKLDKPSDIANMLQNQQQRANATPRQKNLESIAEG
jgi:hypothetical protein